MQNLLYRHITQLPTASDKALFVFSTSLAVASNICPIIRQDRLNPPIKQATPPRKP